jgi:hypothetical protein
MSGFNIGQEVRVIDAPRAWPEWQNRIGVIRDCDPGSEHEFLVVAGIDDGLWFSGDEIEEVTQ